MGRITGVRGDQVIREPDFVPDPSGSASDIAEQKMLSYLSDIATRTFDESRPVDEYQSVSNALTMEVLPEFEMDELIETITIAAKPYSSGTPVDLSSGVVGQKANVSAGDVITGATISPAAGVYNCQWAVDNSAAVGIDNNLGLYNGTTLVATAMCAKALGTYVQAPLSINVASGNAVTVKALAADATGTYNAAIVLTAIPQPNVVTLVLGRRSWAIDMSAWGGVFSVNGLKLRLDRNERRTITQTVAGPLSIELTGHADTRGGW